MKMSRALLCKLLQKKTYDVLSQKHTMLLCFIAIVLLFISAFHFGETLLEWSKEKYGAVFNSYSDNILSKSVQNKLCQYVPIDVVYTWVNGTDPKLINELAQVKKDLGFVQSHSSICPYSHCVKSHMALVKPELPSTITLSDLEEASPVLKDVSRIFIVASPFENYQKNITVWVFANSETADLAVQKGHFHIEGQNYSVSAAFITDDWMAQNTVLLNDVFMMSGVPSGYSKEEIKRKLPLAIQNAAVKMYLYEEKGLIVFTVPNKQILESVMKYENVSIDNKTLTIAAANLVIDFPTGHEDISASRFTDNDELRYSLRSLEKHAPWIRHIYIITNGQIPHWLNLDNPRVTIVTHEEIFSNKSHLPTFSSPAIECHLHKIAGLSRKFIYLNDDVMFGKDVWPEDFYTHTKGQKVYLSWPVPNCADGCPPSWIKDGYCDKPCNNSECQWDGGDCSSPRNLHPFQAVGGDSNSLFGNAGTVADKLYCNTDCANTWLADRYCDKACNLKSCAFDAGDCGVNNYSELHEFILTDTQGIYTMPPGETLAYFNLSILLDKDDTITEGFSDDLNVIRTVAVSLKYKVLTVLFYSNYNTSNVTVTLKGERSKKNFKFSFIISVNTIPLIHSFEENISNNKSQSTLKEKTPPPLIFEEFPLELRYPAVYKQNSTRVSTKYASVNVSASNFSADIINEVQKLEKMLQEDELTDKGFQVKKSQLINEYMELLLLKNLTLPSLVFEKKATILQTQVKPDGIYKNTTLNDVSPTVIAFKNNKSLDVIQKNDSRLQNIQKNVIKNAKDKHDKHNITFANLLNFIQTKGSVRKLKGLDSPSIFSSVWQRQFYSKMRNKKYETPSLKLRHLLDTFGDSLRHVNKLYNEAFGYEARKVPAHIAHFVDTDVMSRLISSFQDEFDTTSSHKIRSPTDMQFSFSYYYYLMSETKSVSLDEVFDRFDTDHSGTWSDREIRTVLTQLYDLPLDYSSVHTFEENIINCSRALPNHLFLGISTPPYERYYDSKLPTVSKQLVLACEPIAALLQHQFGSMKMNKYEVMGEEEVAFKMIHTNLSQVLGQIDDIRKTSKKFICLNDNINHGTKEAEIVQAVLQDFYESLFPVKSQFELPPEYRNRFLYMSELNHWQRLRDIIRIATYICLGLLISFSLVSFCRTEVRPAKTIGTRYSRKILHKCDTLEV